MGGSCWSFPRGWEEGGVLRTEFHGTFPHIPANTATCTVRQPETPQETIQAPREGSSRAPYPGISTPHMEVSRSPSPNRAFLGM